MDGDLAIFLVALFEKLGIEEHSLIPGWPEHVKCGCQMKLPLHYWSGLPMMRRNVWSTSRVDFDKFYVIANRWQVKFGECSLCETTFYSVRESKNGVSANLRGA